MLYDAWTSWIDTFEAAAASGDWREAADRLCEDCVYAVAGGPYATEIRGRSAIIDGFKRSFEHFDDKFERREWRAGKVRLHEPNAVSAVVVAAYEKTGAPPVRVGVDGQWFFTGPQVSLMVDLYDFSLADAAAAIDWLEAHGGPLGLDASYR